MDACIDSKSQIVDCCGVSMIPNGACLKVDGVTDTEYSETCQSSSDDDEVDDKDHSMHHFSFITLVENTEQDGH